MTRSPRTLALSVSLTLAVGSGLVTAGAPASAVGARADDQGKRPVAAGTGGAVASIDFNASHSGIEMLRRGGNAVDAAVAMAATLGVTEPFVAGPGGGGFMVIYLAKTHEVVTINGRETCPQACTRDLFRRPNGEPMPFELARHSGISVGVPGNVATWDKALRRYGTKTLAQTLGPAQTIAQRGFRVDAAFRDTEITALKDLRAFTPSRRLFLTPKGDPLPVGTIFRNPDLARTYADLARYGADYFYTGPLAREVARTVQHPPVDPASPLRVLDGIMRPSDLAAYRAESPEPTHVTYRGHDVYSMKPPSSGGSTVGEALNILAGFDLGAEPRPLALHQYIEALRYSFADRNAYVGDPDYVDVPLHGLLSERYAATRRCLIGDTAATSPVPPGDPVPPYAGCRRGSGAAAPTKEGLQTNHLVAADRFGNVVSYTNTIEQLAGSGITVPGRGFLLNNEMTDFNFAPPAPGAYDPNLPAGGKQPRSSMSPTIVLRDGRPVLAVGAAGGPTIITSVLGILINHLDFGMSLPQAIAAPRISQRNSPTTYAEPAFLDSRVARVLERRYGQEFTELTGPLLRDRTLSNATGLQVLNDGSFVAAAEPVRGGGGSALVVHPR